MLGRPGALSEEVGRMLGGVVSLLVELGRDLDLSLTAGSIERARQAAADVERRDEARITFAAASEPATGEA